MRVVATAAVVALGVALASARVGAEHGGARPAVESPHVAELVRALDRLLALELRGGGWTYARLPGRSPRPFTDPVRFVDWVERRLGWATGDLVVVRSPGTPAAGLALLAGWRATGRDDYLAAARRTGDLLLALQLRSDGWFSEAPVTDGVPAAWFTIAIRRANVDDDVTPGAVRFLLALGVATGDARYRAAADRGLAFLVRAQLANGAWPMVERPFWKRVVWKTFEDVPATNDGATPLAMQTMLEAGRTLGRPELTASARRAGEWLVRVQHAPPAAGWAQQYDRGGAPRRARRFEQPALASWESRHAIDALVALAAATGDLRYCASARAAGAWLEASAIARGCWARLYALDGSGPMYVGDDGAAVGDPAAAHHPYDWRGDFGIPATLAGLRGERIPDGAPIPGDPGTCPGVASATTDPLATGDPRAVIAYAGRVAGLLEPASRSPCAEPVVSAMVHRSE